MKNLRSIEWKSSAYYACAFVSLENIDEYYCLLCDLRFFGDRHLREHILDKQHVDFMYQWGYYLMLLENDRYYCSRCRCVIDDYRKINRHFQSKSHCFFRNAEWLKRNLEILDWNAFDACPCPFVLRRDNDEYHCLVCGIVAVGDRAYEDHVRGKYHKDSALYHGQHISPIKPDSFYCRTCDCKLIYFSKVYMHLLGQKHRQKILCSERKKLPKPHDVEWNGCGYFIRPFIIEAPIGKYFCTICDENLMDEKTLDVHTKGERHVEITARTKHVLLLKDCVFYCDCCETLVPYPNLIKLHIETLKHTYLSKSRVEFTKQKTIDWTNERFACPFVVYQSSDEYYCMLCDIVILGIDSLNCHLREISHSSVMESTGRYVNPLADKTFYCQCCERVILDYRQIRDHSNEESHISMRERMEHEKKNKKTNTANTLQNIEEANESLTKIVKTNEKNDHWMNSKSSKCVLNKESEIETMEINLNVTSHRSCNRGELSKETKNSSFSEIANTDNINDTETNSPSSETVPPNSENGDYEQMLRKNIETHRSKSYAPKKTFDPWGITELVEYCRDIYNMEERLKEIKNGLELCFVTELGEHYCLVCREIVGKTIDKYIEHLGDTDHCEYLEELTKDHANLVTENSELSDLYLARHYMINISELLTGCIVCNEHINRIGEALNDHVKRDDHLERCKDMRAKASQNLCSIASRMQCDWYKVQRYRCELCSLNLDTEIDFVWHLRSKEHETFIKEMKNTKEVAIYDFCELCALIWYGYRCTYATHCDGLLHKWFVRQGYYIPTELPISAWQFLSTASLHVGRTIDDLDDKSRSEKTKIEILMNDLRVAVSSKFSDSNAFTFGSRAFGSNSSNHCIDILVNSGKFREYSKPNESILINDHSS